MTRANKLPRLAAAAGIVCLTLARGAMPVELAPAQPPPLDLFGRLPSLENVVISPNGKRLAFVKTSGDNRALYVIELGGNGSALAAAKIAETKLRNVEWVDDDNILATLSMTGLPPVGFLGAKREWFQMAIFDVIKKKVRPLEFSIDHEETLNTTVGQADVRTVDHKTVIFVPGLYVTDRTLPALFSFTLPELRTKLIDRSSIPDTDWLVDETGQIAAKYTYRDEEKVWEIKARKEGKLVPIATGKASIDTPDILGFDAEGTSIIAEFAVNGDWIWRPLRIKDSVWGEALSGGDTFWHVIKDRKSGRILGGTHGIGDARYVFFDNELQAHWNAVLRAFPDEKVHLISYSDDLSRMVVEVFGAHDGYVYALFDWYTHRAIVIGQVYSGLSTAAEVRPVSYLAADGMRISGFLTLPFGKAAKNLPLVVMPHGGPAAADSGDFDWWAQALASQGYAVLQPNFRGSNVTSELLEAGFGEWGRRMQSDLSDGVRDLAKQV